MSWFSHTKGTWSELDKELSLYLRIMREIMRNYYMHSMEKTIVELHAMLKLAEKGIPKKAATPAFLAIRGGKIQKKKNKSQAAKGKGKGNEKHKQAYALKSKIRPPAKKEHLAKDSIFHHCHEGLRGSIKMKQCALSLYVGNGMGAAVEAI
ncbi:hypothetical protein Tco_0370151 [Tanacetum coccineum]